MALQSNEMTCHIFLLDFSHIWWKMVGKSYFLASNYLSMNLFDFGLNVVALNCGSQLDT